MTMQVDRDPPILVLAGIGVMAVLYSIFFLGRRVLRPEAQHLASFKQNPVTPSSSPNRSSQSTSPSATPEASVEIEEPPVSGPHPPKIATPKLDVLQQGFIAFTKEIAHQLPGTEKEVRNVLQGWVTTAVKADQQEELRKAKETRGLFGSPKAKKPGLKRDNVDAPEGSPAAE